MSVMKWATPFEELDLFKKEMESLLNSSTQAGFDFSPPVEVVDAENDYRVRLLIPGLPAESIGEHVNIEATQKTLTISGELRPGELQANEKRLINQLRYGKFFKQLSFPDGINHEAIEAHYTNGFLEITMPKATSAQKRTIPIQVSSN